MLQKSFLAFLLSVLFVSTAVAGSHYPTNGSAIVDGDWSEWDLALDFFADMHLASNQDKEVLSKAYLRFDCQTETAYVLVLAEPTFTVFIGPDGESWVKLDGQKQVDDTNAPNRFAYILDGPDAVGWEASFPVNTYGTYQIDIHTNIATTAGSTGDTSGTAPTSVVFDCGPTALSLASVNTTSGNGILGVAIAIVVLAAITGGTIARRSNIHLS